MLEMNTGGSDLNDPHNIGSDDAMAEEDKHNLGLLKQAIINKDVMLSGVNNGSPASSFLPLTRVVQDSVRLLQTSGSSFSKPSDIDGLLSKSPRLLAPKQHQSFLNNSQISVESVQNQLPSLSQVLIGNQGNQSSAYSALNQNILNTVSLLANQGILSGSSNDFKVNETNVVASDGKPILTLPVKNVSGAATNNGTPVQHILIPVSSAGMNQFLSIPLSAVAGMENQIQMQNILAKSSGKLMSNTLQMVSSSAADSKPVVTMATTGTSDIERFLAGLVNANSNQVKPEQKVPQATNTAIQNLALQQLVQQQQLAQQQQQQQQQILQQIVQQQLAAALSGTMPSGATSVAPTTSTTSIQLQPAATTAGSQAPIVVIGATQQQLLQQILGGNKPAAVPQQQTLSQQQQQILTALLGATRPQTTPATANQQLLASPVAAEPRFQFAGNTVNDVSGISVLQSVPSVSQPVRLSIASTGLPILQGQHSTSTALGISVSSANLPDSILNSSINQLLPNSCTGTAGQSDGVTTGGTIVDGVNLDEMREFAKQFKLRRLSLGLTQTQVGQALSVTEGPSYSQSAICRFEKLDITPKSAQKIKPVLERWMSMAEEKYKHGVQNLSELIGLESSKKRKRRTSFTPQALEVLSEHFEHCTHPSGAEMTELADKLDFDREVIRVWFCNKRQTLKNTVKRLRATPVSSMSAVSSNS